MNREMISIIVPVYNVEKYIGKCLESLMNQTYTNIEIICVDDKSTDNSAQVCERMKIKDARIRVVREEHNKGLASVRNHGVEEASGEYVAFVDSDDWVTPDYLETLHNLLTLYEADVAQGSYVRTAVELEVSQTRTGNETVKCLTGRDAIKRLFSAPMVQPDIEYTIVCNKLYRKSIIANIFFPEGKIFEDQYFMPLCFYKCRKVAVTDRKLYYYRKNLQGITMQRYTVRFQDDVEIHERLMAYFEKEGESSLTAMIAARVVPLAIDHYYRAEYAGCIDAQRKAYLHILKVYRSYLKSDKVSCKNKLAVLLFLIIPSAFADLKLDVGYCES